MRAANKTNEEVILLHISWNSSGESQKRNLCFKYIRRFDITYSKIISYVLYKNAIIRTCSITFDLISFLFVLKIIISNNQSVKTFLLHNLNEPVELVETGATTILLHLTNIFSSSQYTILLTAHKSQADLLDI